MPTYLDHAVVLLFAVLAPIYGLWSAPRIERDLAAGRPNVRARLYLQTIALQCGFTAIAMTIWIVQGRRLILLGLAPGEGVAFWTAAGLLVVGAGFMVAQVIRVRRSEPARQKVRSQLAHVESILPRTPPERRAFLALAVSSGVCEEILYRSYLIWWGLNFLPTWAAIVGSAAAFGFAHLYQGLDNAMRLFSLGVVFGAIYWLTGSIWLPMAAHVIIDVASGLTAYEALKKRPATANAPAIH